MQSNHIKPEVNYREFRIHKLNTPEFSHVRLLLYWPIFGLLFLFLERLQPQRNYYPVYCGLDDIIPFCEWALIPYLFWFVFLIGTLVYTFFVDVPAFRRMMYFVIVTYTITVLIYLFFPTCQNLRPEAFVRNNLLTRFIELFYSFDTKYKCLPLTSCNRLCCRDVWVMGLQGAPKRRMENRCYINRRVYQSLHRFYETAFYHGCSRCIASLFLWLVDCL